MLLTDDKLVSRMWVVFGALLMAGAVAGDLPSTCEALLGEAMVMFGAAAGDLPGTSEALLGDAMVMVGAALAAYRGLITSSTCRRVKTCQLILVSLVRHPYL